eukprot:Rhum_TRINITY_DN15502_c7_g1::Rhum_TRINITY_DN15502_c7_g1_i1::g.161062::m.161062
MPISMSASMNATAWCSAMGLPKVSRCFEYATASSYALRARPTAPIATGGRVLSKAFMAILKPCPGAPSRFSCGITTLSKLTARVSLQRCPMLISLRPTVRPSVFASTTKPTKPSSDLASRKYQSATPPFVIHILLPFTTQWSPFFTARVFNPCTSEPAPGSVTQYAALSGSSVRRPRYFFFCASLPATSRGAEARPFASRAVPTPLQPYASSSVSTTEARLLIPDPPYSSGTCGFASPASHAFSKMACGYSPLRSSSAATGVMNSAVNLRARSWIICSSSESSKEMARFCRPPAAAAAARAPAEAARRLPRKA